MKATLTFNLPEEQPEFDQATRAGDVECALWEFSQWLRNQVKHGPINEIVDGEEVKLDINTLGVVRHKFYQFFSDVKIEL